MESTLDPRPSDPRRRLDKGTRATTRRLRRPFFLLSSETFADDEGWRNTSSSDLPGTTNLRCRVTGGVKMNSVAPPSACAPLEAITSGLASLKVGGRGLHWNCLPFCAFLSRNPRARLIRARFCNSFQRWFLICRL